MKKLKKTKIEIEIYKPMQDVWVIPDGRKRPYRGFIQDVFIAVYHNGSISKIYNVYLEDLRKFTKLLDVYPDKQSFLSARAEASGVEQ